MSIIGTRSRVIHALLLKEVKTRSPASRLGIVLDVAQPCMQLAMMYSVFWAINRQPDFGNSMFLFLFSGVAPYFLFTHTAAKVMGTLGKLKSLRPLRVVMPIDLAISLAIIELIFITFFIAGALVLAGLCGIKGVVPHDIGTLIMSIVVVSATGMGVGLCNSYIIVLFDFYRLIWTVTVRSLIFLSNVFYVVDFFPPIGRQILWWNPLLHGVIWFRMGMFQDYPHATFSLWYLLAWCVGSILMALILERIIPPEQA